MLRITLLLSAGDMACDALALDDMGRQLSEDSCVTASNDMGATLHSRLPHFCSSMLPRTGNRLQDACY
jgi:hypothetical protein